MKVAYLNGEHLAITSIRLMLQECFGKDNVLEIPFENLNTIHEQDIDLLVLPGVTGETSPYPKHMGEAERESLRRAITENGLILWTDCAATYLMCNKIEYKSSTGEEKTMPGLGLIDGVARGPVAGNAIAPSQEDRFRDVVIRRINYKGERTADVCYGNGPGLFLSDEERNNHDVEIIGHYTDVADAPVAAMTKRVGQGRLISLGVLVQISPEHMDGHLTNENHERHRKALFNHLNTCNDQRLDFLNVLLSYVQSHLRMLGKTGIQKPFLLQPLHDKQHETDTRDWGRTGGLGSGLAGSLPGRSSHPA